PAHAFFVRTSLCRLRGAGSSLLPLLGASLLLGGADLLRVPLLRLERLHPLALPLPVDRPPPLAFLGDLLRGHEEDLEVVEDDWGRRLDLLRPIRLRPFDLCLRL